MTIAEHQPAGLKQAFPRRTGKEPKSTPHARAAGYASDLDWLLLAPEEFFADVATKSQEHAASTAGRWVLKHRPRATRPDTAQARG